MVRQTEKLIKNVSVTSEINISVEKVPEKFHANLKSVLMKCSDIYCRPPNDAGLSQNFLGDLTLKDGDDKNHRGKGT